jgi:DNA-binding NarL/FixJ family response regulator
MEEIASAIGTPPLHATVWAARGALNLHTGDVEGAKQCFEDAIDFFLASDAAFDAARVRLDCARTLEQQGRPSQAMQQAMLAQSAFAQLGAGLYRDRAADVVSRLSGDLGAPPVGAVVPYGLTAREAEVLWLIAAGKTNQEIADALVLSVRTVERHISTVYEKLGVHGRAGRATAASIAVGLGANT